MVGVDRYELFVVPNADDSSASPHRIDSFMFLSISFFPNVAIVLMPLHTRCISRHHPGFFGARGQGKRKTVHLGAQPLSYYSTDDASCGKWTGRMQVSQNHIMLDTVTAIDQNLRYPLTRYDKDTIRTTLT